MQIIVLGMHRSGTSAITRIINLMGAYIGPEDLLMPPVAEVNPKGFWERHDVVALNDETLKAFGSSWCKVSNFNISSLSEEALHHFNVNASYIINKLDLHRPWVLKDPRLSLLLPLWKKHLETPVVVLCTRSPLSIAASLQKRDGFSFEVGLALWEYYTVHGLNAAADFPIVLVSFEDLIANPSAVTKLLYSKLRLHNPRGLKQPTAKEIKAFIEPKLQHNKHKTEKATTQLSDAQIALWESTQDNKLPMNRSELRVSESALETLKAFESREISTFDYSKELREITTNRPQESIKSLYASPTELYLKLNSKITHLDNVASDLLSRLNSQAIDQEAKISELTSNINSHSAQQEERISELTSKLDSHTANLEARISKLTSNINSHSAEQEARISELTSNLDSHSDEQEERISELTSKFNSHSIDQEKRISELTSKFNSHSIDQEKRIGKLTSKLDTAELQAERLDRVAWEVDLLFSSKSKRNYAVRRALAPFRLLKRWLGYVLHPIKAIKLERDIRILRKSDLFDVDYYLSHNRDVSLATVDPIRHYCVSGWKEERNPSAEFITNDYLISRPDVASANINPLIHYIRYGHYEIGDPTEHLLEQQATFSGKQEVESCYESNVLVPNLKTDIKLIAFYLPQYHPIPENDLWWGKGFTEWTNVTKARPQFKEHYQPKLPDELGFYDLRIPDIQKRQIELARQHGIYGFCYYYYWFGGKKLLDRPLNQVLENPELDLPFCICWANENWTRRWDGRDNEILISQEHSPEQDLAFIRDIEPILRDKRYIRIDGKPLLIIYRPDLLPDPKGSAKRWIDYCEKAGVGKIVLAMVQTNFGPVDPQLYGLEAAIEFPPNDTRIIKVDKTLTKINKNFSGLVYSYPHVVEFNLQKTQPKYRWFRGLMTGWDNTARRDSSSHIAWGSSPDLYQKWLSGLCKYTRKHHPADERLIFVNAWNEWAEGAYLEPDTQHGFAYLNRTAAALSEHPLDSTPGSWKILFISHDACMGGAQKVLLEILTWFKQHTNIEMKILCLSGGAWLPRFKSMADTLVLSELKKQNPQNSKILQEIIDFCGDKPDLLYGNTAVAGRVYSLLSNLGVPIVTHLHELESSINKYARKEIIDVVRYSDHYIACSKAVRDNLVKHHDVDPDKVSIAHASIVPIIKSSIGLKKSRTRKSLGLNRKNTLIIGCGVGSFYQKGADFFIEVARALRKQGNDNFHFYWIGGFPKNEKSEVDGRVWKDILSTMKTDGIDKFVTFLGQKDNPREYMKAGDIFLLPSREDSFPLVCLEAAESGLPVICFADAGGAPEFVEDDAGFVVPYSNIEAMAGKVEVLLHDQELGERMGNRGKEKLFTSFTISATAPKILSICRSLAERPPAVSVIVPNYNHEKFLTQRLESVFNQTLQDFEVILLDDASTDDSLEILENNEHRADVTLIKNTSNSGSTYHQWAKGLAVARGEVLWIAESDDYCELDFLETLLPRFAFPNVKLAFSCSHIVDEKNRIIGDYLGTEYLTSLSRTKWQKSYQVPDHVEIKEALGIKNTVLNASSVLIRRFPVNKDFLSELGTFKLAGDWFVYINAIFGGDIFYEARKLNYHRQHANSVITQAVSDDRKNNIFKEMARVQEIIFERYPLDREFHDKWEKYLRQQWYDFHPESTFKNLTNFYPMHKLRELILRDSRESDTSSNNLPTEKAAKSPDIFLSEKGFCPACEQETTFVSKYFWLRDHYKCSLCNSIPRQRALHNVMNTLFPTWKKSKVHEAGPGNKLIRQLVKHYSASHYYPDKPLGSKVKDYRNENLECLTFGDEEFDFFISLDVMEHVFQPELAFQEMLRVTKTDGAVVLTTPRHKIKSSIQRASIDKNENISHILPEEYHGNPIGDGRSLVTWDYGEDFEELIAQWSGYKCETIDQEIPYLGILGEFIDVFVIRKT